MNLSLRQFLPPLLYQWIRCRLSGGNHFSGPFSNWQNAAANASGYDQDFILAQVMKASQQVQAGQAAFERDSIAFDKLEFPWPVLTALLWAASGRPGFTVLDFGGALGSSYYQCRSVLDKVPDLRWYVVEQANYVDAGRAHFQNETLRFQQSIAAVMAEAQTDLILLSGVLQYLPEPWQVLDELMATQAEFLVLDRSIMHSGTEDRAFVQHVPPSIYAASYPCWHLSEARLMAAVQGRYQLVSDFRSLAFPTLACHGAEFKGYLFRRQCP